MIEEFEIFINYSILVYTLFLLLPSIEWLIEQIGKGILYLIRNCMKIIIILNTTVITYLWLMILGSVIIESANFYYNNNYQIDNENIKIIIFNAYNKMLWKKNL